MSYILLNTTHKGAAKNKPFLSAEGYLFFLLLSVFFLSTGGLYAQCQTLETYTSMGNTIQTSTVPAGITSVIITAVGADGGGPSGGSGATASGTFSVSVGQELELVVGIAGEVTNGGGGSGVRTTVGQNVLVIGGGGGGGGIIVRAPFDQNVLVTDKTAGVDNSTTGENVIIDGGGEGGRASENGGNGGGSGTNLGGSGGSNGNGGGSGLGGGGGGLFTDGVSNSFGGFGGSSDFGGTGNGVGGGGGGSGLAGGGGGGGGYSGGGGGADQNGGGGGGSFVDATGTNPVFTTGANAIGSIQNGSVTLCYISGALPATMTYFRSTPQDKRIQLEWGTAREVNNNGFEVQRSTDEISFVNIAWVAGRGSSNEEHFYQFIDEEVQASTTYFYRLKQVDTDGTASYSSVRSAMVTDRSLVQVSEFFPNPVGKALGIANIRVNMAEAGQMTIQLIDSQGRLVKELSKAYSSGQSTLAIPIREVPTGQYFVKMRLREEVAYRKLVVN